MNILLVHGAFHDGHCWDELIPHLSRLGHDVRSVTLSGHGTSTVKPWRITMSTYAEDVCHAAKQFSQPCCVIGHSMGGLVITAAAERQPALFSQLIYVAAVVPRQKGMSLAAHDMKNPSKPIRRAMKINPFSFTATMDGNAAKDIFYNRCSDEVKNKAISNLCQQPLRPSLSSVSWSMERVGSIRKAYIECTADNAIPIHIQKMLQKNMIFSRIESLDSDHSPFLSMPEKLAACILQ